MMAGIKYWDLLQGYNICHYIPEIVPRGVKKVLAPLKMSLEMAHKVIVPPKINYIPQFLKQRDINS